MIEIKHLNLYFSNLLVLNNISFTLKDGEVLGIAGESGSGKSALAKSLLCLYPNLSGQILYKGINLLSLPEREMRHMRKEIGFIPQDPMSSLNPTKKIHKQITEGTNANAKELLIKVGIRDVDRILNAYPHTLSGGQRQRVLIASALASNPSLLIADEPTTSLDVTIQAQILELLQSLHMTTIFISHDLRLLSRICDRIMIMYAGNIVECAPTQQLFENPRHPYTRKLLDLIKPQKRLSPIPGSPPTLQERPTGCPFAPRCPLASTLCKQNPTLTNDEHQVACHHVEEPRVATYFSL